VQNLGIALKKQPADRIIDEKGLSEETVAFLFLIGFVSAGISASFTGTFADRYGRKTACLAYCTIYSFSCLTLLTDDILILFVGRILGGFSGTLLWSVFESWLVAEYNKLMLEDSASHMSGIFSMMTTLNSLVAICAGIIAEWLVSATGTAKAPFLASIGCLFVSFVAISKHWVSRDWVLRFEPVVNGNRARTTVLVIATRLKAPLCYSKKKRSKIIQLLRRYDTFSEVSIQSPSPKTTC
jgi:MFS family permease